MKRADESYRSGYAERLKASIARYSPADQGALLEFSRAMYGASSITADPDYLAWLYERAPGAQAAGPALWLYKNEGRVEGQQGAIRVRLKAGGERREAMWALNLMVDPKLRMRGIGPVLGHVAFSGGEVLLGLEVMRAARSDFLRAGWVDAGAVPLYVRPLRVGEMLRIRAGVSVSPLAAGAADGALAAVDRLIGGAAALTGLVRERVDHFDERAAQLWRDTSGAIPIAVERDLPYLTWRYDAYPRRDRYQTHYFLRGGELRAWVVTRVGEWDRIPAGFLVDFAGSLPDLFGAFSELLRYFRGEGASAVYCLQSSPTYASLLRSLGFLKRDSTWTLMAKAPDGDEALRGLLANQENFFITFGDGVVDRPREGTIYTPEGAA